MPDVIELPTTALILEGDGGEREKLRRILLELGVDEVETPATVELAMAAMDAKVYGIVVLDWEIGTLPGLALFNRVKSLPNFSSVPVLVSSKLMHKRDFEALRDYPCAQAIAKPVSRRYVEPIFMKIVAEHNWYIDNTAYVEALLQLVDADPNAIVKELRQLMTEAPEPVPLSLLLAKVLVDQGFLQAAEAVLSRLASLAPRSPAVLWQLARVYYLLNRPAEARRLLSDAERVSSVNVERLFLQGEVSLTLHDTAAAKTYFQRCLAIDPGHHRAQAGETVATNLDGFVRKHAARKLPRTLAAMCNLVGVNMAQSGKVDAGIGQYQAAMTFIGDVPESSRIAFNLGLGYLRKNEAATAVDWFRKAEELAGHTYSKATRFRKETQARLASSSTETTEPMVPAVMEDVDMDEERIGAPPAPKATSTGSRQLEVRLMTLASEIPVPRSRSAG